MIGDNVLLITALALLCVTVLLIVQAHKRRP